MEQIPKTTDLLPRLKSFDTFKDIEDQALQWLIDQSEYHFYRKGDFLFEPEQAVDHMQVLMQGRYSVRVMRNGRMRELGVWETGYITGVLPFSRMKQAVATGQVIDDCYVLALHRKHFTEMVNVSFELTQTLVSFMTSRVRDFSLLRFQDEKLMALGKLSAGLAHELNNPASAMVRNAEELYNKIHTTPEKFKAIMAMNITPEETDQVNEILFSKIRDFDQKEMTLLEREAFKDDIIDWLEDRNIEDADEVAETFTDFGLGIEELDEVEHIIEGRSLGAIVWWLESTLSLERLVTEIRESADRISNLVKSIKDYSHMDRAVSMEQVQLYEGIKSTLIMLKHQLKTKNIQIVKNMDFDLPPVNAFAGELNQVWTNMFCNAIDAMDEGGILSISTYRDRDLACVEIGDTGHGIPEEIQTRIFEPFFTTKKMGEGTGMGLEIVKRIVDRHGADISVVSMPGKTTFKLCFPLAQ
ncbi:MAG TPA: ATP-binding protein [Saprospiraceae bacterium]|nr:ATP-binding protein [Saprospiraceae bacterium]HMQ82795.1 ATP-binding protein [Saprospiraceae bacterium]